MGNEKITNLYKLISSRYRVKSANKYHGKKTMILAPPLITGVTNEVRVRQRSQI